MVLGKLIVLRGGATDVGKMFAVRQQWLIRLMYQVGINYCWASSNSGKHSNTTVSRICVYT